MLCDLYTHLTQTHTTKGMPAGLLPVSKQQLFLIYERFGCHHRQRHTHKKKYKEPTKTAKNRQLNILKAQLSHKFKRPS